MRRVNRLERERKCLKRKEVCRGKEMFKGSGVLLFDDSERAQKVP